LARLLRFDVRYGIRINEQIVLIIRNGVFYEINIKTKEISSGFRLVKGNRVLNIVQVNNLNGFDDSFYFGEYFYNPNRDAVVVYKRIGKDEWEKVFEFPEGKINHIHNLVPDKSNNCIWILTGDYEHSSAIWKAKNNFKTVDSICGGDQIFRSCFAVPYGNGLLYATDTPFQLNTVRRLYFEGEKWKTIKIADINGSVVYSTNFQGKSVFSTIVESNGFGPMLRELFVFKRGDGIINNEVVTYQLNDNYQPVDILSDEKDILPFYFFQFGAACFPTGVNNSDYLPIYNIGTKKYDLSLVLYKK
jgi:hypothetical protein